MTNSENNDVWRNEDGTVDWKALLISELMDEDYPQWEIDLIVDVVENGR